MGRPNQKCRQKLQRCVSLRCTARCSFWHGLRINYRKKVALALALSLAGENVCPLEDVGGAPGYEDFVQALANPAHPEHDERKEWVGRPFDPAAFDVAEINQWLNHTES